MMMGWGGALGGMGWLGWLWPLVMVLFWAAAIALGVWLVQALTTRPAPGETAGGGALETLKRRYASGEITREEFEEGRRLLGA